MGSFHNLSSRGMRPRCRRAASTRAASTSPYAYKHSRMRCRGTICHCPTRPHHLPEFRSAIIAKWPATSAIWLRLLHGAARFLLMQSNAAERAAWPLRSKTRTAIIKTFSTHSARHPHQIHRPPGKREVLPVDAAPEVASDGGTPSGRIYPGWIPHPTSAICLPPPTRAWRRSSHRAT